MKSNEPKICTDLSGLYFKLQCEKVVFCYALSSVRCDTIRQLCVCVDCVVILVVCRPIDWLAIGCEVVLCWCSHGAQSISPSLSLTVLGFTVIMCLTVSVCICQCPTLARSPRLLLLCCLVQSEGGSDQEEAVAGSYQHSLVHPLRWLSVLRHHRCRPMQRPPQVLRP